MLVVNNIEVKYFGIVLALKGISLEVADGEIRTLIGANGAGKTTVLRSISGLLKTNEGHVTSGSIMFDGKRIENRDPEQIGIMGITQVMEGRRVLEHLTVEENLRLGAIACHSRGMSLKWELDRVYSYFPKLVALRNQISGYISGGEQQMLVIGRALISHPKLMLLDELGMGLAPLLVKEIFEILKEINATEKTSMLLVEQNARLALSCTQYGYVIENGRVVLDGPSEKLMANEDIKEFYLGLSAVGSGKNFRDVKHYRRRKRWLG